MADILWMVINFHIHRTVSQGPPVIPYLCEIFTLTLLWPGTHTPTKCANGTWSNVTQLTSQDECNPCPAGWYCQQNGLTEPEDLCLQGYYCPEGSYLPNPVICPIGLHCPTGSDQPKSCSAGFYTNMTGRWTCDICPDGWVGWCMHDCVYGCSKLGCYYTQGTEQ